MSAGPGELELPELEGGFSRRRIAWAAAVAFLSFCAFVLLLAFGRELQPEQPGPHTYSRSALGYRALAELLRQLDLPVVSRQTRSGGGIGPERPLVVAEPDPGRGGGPDRLRALAEEARGRSAPLVLVLPKWEPHEAKRGKPEWLDHVELVPVRRAAATVSALADPDLDSVVPRRQTRPVHRCTARWRPGDPPAPFGVELGNPVQLLPPQKGLEPWVTCDGGVLVAAVEGTQRAPKLVLVADPDLLNNHGLGRGDNAVLVQRLLSLGLVARGAVFDETVHGFEHEQGLLAEAFSFPMVLGVTQGLVLLGLVLWAGMGRFGKPLPASGALPPGKEVLIGNTAELLTQGGYVAESLGRYFRQTTRAVAAHYFLPPDLPDAERLARLQKLTDGRPGRRTRALDLVRLERDVVALPSGRAGAAQAAWMAEALYRWRVEMTNGNRQST